MLQTEVVWKMASDEHTLVQMGHGWYGRVFMVLQELDISYSILACIL